jgi:phenylalanyl-tRNA synthetase beta chain
VARIRGYGRVPVRLSLPVHPVAPGFDEQVSEVLRTALTGEGFHEALTLPFVAETALDDVSPWTEVAAVRVDNPTRAEEPLLRRSLMGPLLRSLERNRARGVSDVRLFEIGRVFLAQDGDSRPLEPRLLAGIVEGDYADIRGALDAALDALGLSSRVVFEAREDAGAPFDAGRTAGVLLDGRLVALVGELDASHLATLGVHREGLRAAAFELDLEHVLDAIDLEPPLARVPVVPQVQRDLAFVFDTTHHWADLESVVRNVAGALLRGVRLFDEYRGKSMPAGKRSLAFRVVLGADDRTLNGEEVDACVEAIVAALQADSIGGELRS